MDNLRKTNAFIGEITKDVNVNTTDAELAGFVDLTIGEMSNALAALPESVKRLKMGDLMTLAINSEDITDETLTEIFGGNQPTDAELQEFFGGLCGAARTMFGSDEDDP